MTEHTFLGATMIAFFCFLGFACWLMARYGGGGRTMKREPYSSTTITFEPRGGIETAPTRKPKPVPPVRLAQPNRRRKKKKARNKK